MNGEILYMNTVFESTDVSRSPSLKVCGFRRKDGLSFVLQSESSEASSPDTGSVDTGLTTAEIVETTHEGRERHG